MIYPRCHPYWIIDGKKVINEEYGKLYGFKLAYTGDGYMLPCCWLDGGKKIREISLFNENLKVENNNSIDDILRSSEWQEFHNNLLTNPEQCPKTCKDKCSINPGECHVYEYV